MVDDEKQQDEQQDELQLNEKTSQETLSYSVKIINRQQPGVGFMTESFKTLQRKKSGMKSCKS